MEYPLTPIRRHSRPIVVFAGQNVGHRHRADWHDEQERQPVPAQANRGAGGDSGYVESAGASSVSITYARHLGCVCLYLANHLAI